MPDAAGREGSASGSEAAGLTHQGFPRSRRLTSRRQFQAVYNEGRRASCRCFTLFALPNALGHCRLGLTVTRKAGAAVARNRIKRLLREAFRRNRRRMEQPMDLVINGRAAALERPLALLERDLLQCYARACAEPR